ncbi:unnamed protein product [Moneuplotes crassus]|uniref:Hexose transporter 1 n=2 Tax=Euplotes crassus TaxID=5936 RepID=A0AAD1TZX8_EUPCR|nr:unnamed protein product [Moneuplotes crassus]
MNINQKRNYLRLWIATIALGGIQYGYSMGELNTFDLKPTCMRCFQHGDKVNPCSNDTDVYSYDYFFMYISTCMVPLGAIFSSIYSGTFLSLRKALFIANIFCMVGRGINAIHIQYATLAGRFVNGLGVGIFSVIVPMFINEISPTKRKGSYGIATQIGITGGIFISYIVAKIMCFFNEVPPFEENKGNKAVKTNFTILYLFPILFCLLQTALLKWKFKYEAPKYYIIKEEYDVAQTLIQDILERNEAKEESNAGHSIYTDNSNALEINTIDPVSLNKYNQNWDGRKFSSIFKPKYWRSFLVGCILSMLQQLSGINIIIFYSGEIFNKENNVYFGYIPMILGFINFLCTIIATMLKFPFKSRLLIGLICLIVCSSTLFVFSAPHYEKWCPKSDIADDPTSCHIRTIRNVDRSVFIIFTTLFLISFALTIGPITWIMIAEILTERGMGIAISLNWALIIIIGVLPALKITPIEDTYVEDKDFYPGLNFSVLFFIFSGILMFGFVMILLNVKETYGLELHEIRELYKNEAYDPLIRGRNRIDSEEESLLNSISM